MSKIYKEHIQQQEQQEQQNPNLKMSRGGEWTFF